VETITMKFSGTAPMLMHSARGANPLDPLAKELKKYTSKRTKTDDDYNAIAKIEFMMALYWNEECGVMMPSNNVRATILAGGKLSKLGAKIGRSTMIPELETELEYDGKKAGVQPEDLFTNKFTFMSAVNVGTSKTIRCRPIFHNWHFQFDLAFDESMIDKAELVSSAENAGKYVGLGDWRPAKNGSYGRFDVEVLA